MHLGVPHPARKPPVREGPTPCTDEDRRGQWSKVRELRVAEPGFEPRPADLTHTPRFSFSAPAPSLSPPHPSPRSVWEDLAHSHPPPGAGAALETVDAWGGGICGRRVGETRVLTE